MWYICDVNGEVDKMYGTVYGVGLSCVLWVQVVQVVLYDVVSRITCDMVLGGVWGMGYG